MGNFKIGTVCAFLLLGFIGLSSGNPVQAAEPTPSPDFQCPNNEDGFYLSTTSCSVYFYCTNGLAWRNECPHGLYFNLARRACDYAENVPCDVGQKNSPKGSEIIGPAPDYNCTRNGAHPHETDCVLFYDCWEGEANLFTCTDRMLYDLNYNGCNFASQVDCGDRFRPTDVPSTVTPPSNITTRPPPPGNFTCPEAGGAFPHAEYCEYYYTCWEWEPRLDKCAGIYLFDLTYDGCNFPEQTYCGDRTRPEGYPGTSTPWAGSTRSTTARTTTTQIPSDCPSDGDFPHEEYCEYYYQCRGGSKTLVKCPADFLFDTNSNECHVPRDVDCGDRTRPIDYPGTVTPPSNTSTTTIRTTTTQGPDPGTTSPLPDTTTTSRTTTTQPPGEFTCPEPEGNFSDPADCSGFYSCLGGQIIGHQFCPDGLYFNPVINNCDFPWNVDCPNGRH